MNKINRNEIKKFWHYLISLRYVKVFSYNSARALKNKLNQSHKEKYVFYYGFQILYGAINKFLLLITAGLLLHVLPQILIATLSFMLLRVFIGGLHYDSYTKCAWVSLTCLVTAGLLAKYIPYNYIVNNIIFATLLCIILKYAPVEHKNRPLTENKKIRFKYIALILLIVVYSIQQIIGNYYQIMNNCIMYGVLLSGIIALPAVNSVEKRG